MRNVGQFEREAIERRRDQLLDRRKYHGLSPNEGSELDGCVAIVGMPEDTVTPTDMAAARAALAGRK